MSGSGKKHQMRSIVPDGFNKVENAGDYWEYFDKVFCISLDERADRREEARLQFDLVGLSDKVEFVVVKRHPVDCEQGIYESHMTCIKKGLQEDARNIVIFEDDVVFDRFSPDTMKNCIDFLSTDAGWNIMFFGCMVKTSKRTRNRSVLKVRFRSLTHSYVLNRRFAETLVNIPWQKIPFDDMLRDLKDDRMYAVYPSFAFQSNSRSDNQRYLALDKFRRVCGGLKRLQKINQLYNHRKVLFIVAHTLIAVSLITMLAI